MGARERQGPQGFYKSDFGLGFFELHTLIRKKGVPPPPPENTPGSLGVGFDEKNYASL